MIELTAVQRNALARAATRLQDWVGFRIDDRAEDLARLYRDSRATLAERLRYVYDSFLAGEPSVMKARASGADVALKQAIDVTIDELTNQVGAEATTSIQSLLGGQPSAVNRYLGKYLELPAVGASYDLNPRWVLQELSTSVIGGGTYFDRLLNIGENMKSDLTKIVRQGLISGADFDTIRDRTMTAFGVDKLPEPKFNAYGSVQTYKNEARRQWSLLMQDTADEIGADQVWWATLDERTTPGCAARHGHKIQSELPPRHFNCRCVPVGTVVEGNVVLGTKMLYAGQVRKIKTAAGHVLSITPNHPIPTLAGWKPADCVVEGDYVASYSGWVEEDTVQGAVSFGKTLRLPNDNQYGPTLIEDVFESIRRVGGATGRIGRVPHDFDGDAAAGQGDIEIVAVQGVLLNDGPVGELAQQVGDFPLHPAYLARPNHAARRDGTLVSGRFLDAGYSRQSRLNRRLDIPPETPPEPCRFGLSPELNAVLEELAFQGAVRYASFARELTARLPGLVSLDQVVKVWDEEFRGHVYDLQSTSGVFIASNVVISNCQIVVMAEGTDLTEFQAAGDAWLQANGYQRKAALAMEAWSPEEHPRDEEVQFTDTGAAAKAHADLDKLRGTRLAGRPKTDVSSATVFGRPVDYRGRGDVSGEPEVASVKISDLIPTQDTMSRAALHTVIDKPSGDLPVVHRAPDGKQYIFDGHHRIAVELFKGKTDVRVTVRTLSEAWSPEDHPRDPNGRFSASGAPALHTIRDWAQDAGGTFNGVQEFPSLRSGRKAPDYATITDKKTGSTILLPIDKDLTPQAIQAKLEKMRKTFHKETEAVQWGAHQLTLLACEEAETVEAWDADYRGSAAWRYQVVPWRALPSLVRTGVTGTFSAPSLLEAYRRSDPSSVVLRFPQVPGPTPARRVQVLSEDGWVPLQPKGAHWVEIRPGEWVADSPTWTRWQEAAVRLSPDTVEEYPQLGGLALRAAPPYRVSVQAGSPAGPNPDTWPPGADSGRNLPALVDAALAAPLPPDPLLGISDRNGLAVVVGLNGRVLYARDSFKGLGLSTYERVAAYCPGSAPGTVWAVRPVNHGQWVLPGGHVDKGETKEQAVVREMREETGLHTAVVRYLGAIHRPWATTHVYLVQSSEHGRDKPSTPDEIAAVRIVPLDDLDPSERVWLVQQDITMEAWDPKDDAADPERYQDAQFDLLDAASREAEFDSQEHPRDDGGKFTFKGQAASWQTGDVEKKDTKQAAAAYARDAFTQDASQTEGKALRAYQNFGYKRVNGQLRRGDAFDPEVKSDSTRLSSPSVGKTVKDMDAAIDRSRVTRDTVVYHGFSIPRDRLVGFKVGDVLSDPGYLSTSLMQGVAQKFGGDVAEIRLPVGSPAFSMDHAGLTGGKGMYGPPGWKTSEGEVILPRDARFKVVDVRDNVDTGANHDDDLRAGMGSMHFILEYAGAKPTPRPHKGPKKEPK